jgi:hypothetical protein
MIVSRKISIADNCSGNSKPVIRKVILYMFKSDRPVSSIVLVSSTFREEN